MRGEPPDDVLGRAGLALGDHADADEGTDEREAGALDAEEPGADRTEPLALDEGADAGGKEGHRDEEALRLEVVDLESARDEEGRRDDGDEDGEEVLEGREERGEERGAFLDAVDESRVLAGEDADEVDETGGFLGADHAVRADVDEGLQERVAVGVDFGKGLDQPEEHCRFVVVDLAVGDNQVLRGVQHLPERPLFLRIHLRHIGGGISFRSWP